METEAQRCNRIVTALEDLAGQEATALANRDFATVLALQERTQPLVDFVVSSGAVVAKASGLRVRIAALRDRRDRTSSALSAQLEQTRADLAQLQVKQRRVARIMPAYGQPAEATRHFQAIG
ncbi:hypothetical protein [Horticoccus sp. 23ND18S-11]